MYTLGKIKTFRGRPGSRTMFAAYHREDGRRIFGSPVMFESLDAAREAADEAGYDPRNVFVAEVRGIEAPCWIELENL